MLVSNMTIPELLSQGRAIWGAKKFTLSEIIIRLGVGTGDLCRIARHSEKDAVITNDEETKKELGNIIFSTIRWCDDLGFNPEECIQKAIAAQQAFAAKNSQR